MNALHLVNQLLEDERKTDWSPDPEAEPIYVETRIERWVFNRSELHILKLMASDPDNRLRMSDVCRGDHRLIAYVYKDKNNPHDPGFLGTVAVLRNGTVLNYDRKGEPVSDEMRQLAKYEEILANRSGNAYDCWKDVLVDKNGKFVEFAEKL